MRLLCLGFLLLHLSAASAQSFRFEMEDNQGQMSGMIIYEITPDSLYIKSKSDYGRTNVDYIQRKLTKKEAKTFSKFVKSFPLDSLRPVYFNEYNNFDYIDAEHFPRIIALNIHRNDKFYGSKCTNAYVRLYDRLSQQINALVPNEVKIKIDSTKFNVFY